METSRLNSKKTQVARFGAVGMFNTLFDFSILNVLVFGTGMPKIGANIISTSAAMAASYLLNHSFVFKSSEAKSVRTFLKFAAITAIGVYVVQNALIYLLAHAFTAPADVAFNVVDWILPDTFSRDFVTLNFAKVIATLVSMTWNYVMYSRFLFRSNDAKHSDAV